MRAQAIVWRQRWEHPWALKRPRCSATAAVFSSPFGGRRKQLQSPSDVPRSRRWEGLTPQRVLFSVPLFPRFQRIPPVPLVTVTLPLCIHYF